MVDPRKTDFDDESELYGCGGKPDEAHSFSFFERKDGEGQLTTSLYDEKCNKCGYVRRINLTMVNGKCQ